MPSVRSNNNNLVPIVLSPVVVNMMQGPVVNTSHLTRNVTIRGATRAAVLSKAKPIETVLINLERQSWAQLTRLSRGNAQVAQVSERDEEEEAFLANWDLNTSRPMSFKCGMTFGDWTNKTIFIFRWI